MGKTISELIEKTSASDSDVLLIEGTSTNKITKANFLKEIAQELSYDNGSLEGNYITVSGSKEGSITDIEILGNTVQSSTNLADIQSVGTLQEDGRYKLSILSCGKNLFDGVLELGGFTWANGLPSSSSDRVRSVNFIKVKSNTSIIANISGVNCGIFEFDKNFVFIKSTQGQNKIVTSSTTCYIKIQDYTTDLTKNIQLEEGTVATSYEPYKENKSSILLPCQLEKVGTVSDRLFRREDGVWCVEKNIETVNLDNLNFSNASSYDLTNTSYWYTSAGVIKNVLTTSATGYLTTKGISINYGNISTTDSVGVGLGTTGVVRLRILKTETIQEATKNWMIKYQLATPQIIELPLDTQIQLNSFNGVTNIFTEDTVIEPTIKATVPKSLGASVQSLVNKTDNLSDRVEAVEKLKKGSELEVSAENGYVVCENTNNGQIEGLKIEGKTLVNLFDAKDLYNKDIKFNISGDGFATYKSDFGYGDYIHTNISQFKPNTKYTIIIESKDNKTNGVITLNVSDPRTIFQGASTSIGSTIFNAGENIAKMFTMKTASTFTETMKWGIYLVGNNLTGTVSLRTIILEGDHTQNPPSYFEGLKSVGDGVDKIEVLSRKEDGNLFNSNWIIGKIDHTTGQYATGTYYCSNYVLVPSATTIYTNFAINVFYYDKNKNFISFGNTVLENHSFTTPSNCRYIRVYRGSIPSNAILSVNKLVTSSVCKENKKQILIQNSDGTYEKPILRSTGNVSDTIEKHSDGKYYYHKRCEEVTLNGSESTWFLDTGATSHEDTLFFATKNISLNPYANYCISDKFLYSICYSKNVDKEGIYVSPYGYRIRILKSKLSTQDVTGFKAWLQSNNVTVVYQLATEEVYECVNLDLDSYEGETSVIFDGGAISPKITFKIASHIANTIKVLKDRINYLEGKVMDMFKAVLAGDVQTLAYELYPEDFEVEETETIEN